MKKSMENKIAFVKSNAEGQFITKETNSIVWWGVVSIILIILTFQDLFG